MAVRLTALSGMSHGETDRFVAANVVRQKGVWDWSVLDARLADAGRPLAAGAEAGAEVPVAARSVAAAASAAGAASHRVPSSTAQQLWLQGEAAVAVSAGGAGFAGELSPLLMPPPLVASAKTAAEGDEAEDEEGLLPLVPPSPPRFGGPLLVQPGVGDEHEETTDAESDEEEDPSPEEALAPEPRSRQRFTPRMPGSQSRAANSTKWVPGTQPLRKSSSTAFEPLVTGPWPAPRRRCEHRRLTKPSDAGCMLVCGDCGESVCYDGWRLEHNVLGRMAKKGLGGDLMPAEPRRGGLDFDTFMDFAETVSLH